MPLKNSVSNGVVDLSSPGGQGAALAPTQLHRPDTNNLPSSTPRSKAVVQMATWEDLND